MLPDINLDDPNIDPNNPDSITSAIKTEKPMTTLGHARTPKGQPGNQVGSEEEKESMLESMVEDTGTLEIDDDGFWDFHGHSSGRAFLLKMRQQFGDLMGKPEGHAMPFMKSPDHTDTLVNSPAASVTSPMGLRPPNLDSLPPKNCAILLCKNALDDTCAVLRFIHHPTFYEMLDRIYDAPRQSLGSHESKFLSLLYSVIALGTLFATGEQSQLMTNGFENAIDQG